MDYQQKYFKEKYKDLYIRNILKKCIEDFNVYWFEQNGGEDEKEVDRKDRLTWFYEAWKDAESLPISELFNRYINRKDGIVNYRYRAEIRACISGYDNGFLNQYSKSFRTEIVNHKWYPGAEMYYLYKFTKHEIEDTILNSNQNPYNATQIARKLNSICIDISNLVYRRHLPLDYKYNKRSNKDSFILKYRLESQVVFNIIPVGIPKKRVQRSIFSNLYLWKKKRKAFKLMNTKYDSKISPRFSLKCSLIKLTRDFFELLSFTKDLFELNRLDHLFNSESHLNNTLNIFSNSLLLNRYKNLKESRGIDYIEEDHDIVENKTIKRSEYTAHRQYLAIEHLLSALRVTTANIDKTTLADFANFVTGRSEGTIAKNSTMYNIINKGVSEKQYIEDCKYVASKLDAIGLHHIADKIKNSK